MLFYWAKGGEFVVGKGGATCDTTFRVEVGEEKVVITKQDRVGGRVVKEETRLVSLIDLVDVIHKLWWENSQ
jgi:hypothetical protein